MGLIFNSIPTNSIMILRAEERSRYIQSVSFLPRSLQNAAGDAKTGAYIQGVAKAHDLSQDSAPKIALIVLRVYLGEIPLAKLATSLSSNIVVPNDKSEKMAKELEHDLFAPVAIELNQFVATRKKEAEQVANKATGNPAAAGATNVLDLKNKPKPPTPPPVPRPR